MGDQAEVEYDILDLMGHEDATSDEIQDIKPFGFKKFSGSVKVGPRETLNLLRGMVLRTWLLMSIEMRRKLLIKKQQKLNKVFNGIRSCVSR